MKVNRDIEMTAWRALRGEIRAYEDRPGMCLAWVRTVVETSLGWDSHRLYVDYVTGWVQPEGYDRSNGHWARDAERSLRDRGMAVSLVDAQPGDLMFNWKAAWSDRWGTYIGHVGILTSGGFVAENIDSRYRPHSLTRSALALTPLDHWAEPTTIIRFDPEPAV